VAEFICKSLLYFCLRVQFRRKESSRSLSHLLMSFLSSLETLESGSNQRLQCANRCDYLPRGLPDWTFHPPYTHIFRSDLERIPLSGMAFGGGTYLLWPKSTALYKYLIQNWYYLYHGAYGICVVSASSNDTQRTSRDLTISDAFEAQLTRGEVWRWTSNWCVCS